MTGNESPTFVVNLITSLTLRLKTEVPLEPPKTILFNLLKSDFSQATNTYILAEWWLNVFFSLVTVWRQKTPIFFSASLKLPKTWHRFHGTSCSEEIESNRVSEQKTPNRTVFYWKLQGGESGYKELTSPTNKGYKSVVLKFPAVRWHRDATKKTVSCFQKSENQTSKPQQIW